MNKPDAETNAIDTKERKDSPAVTIPRLNLTSLPPERPILILTKFRASKHKFKPKKLSFGASAKKKLDLKK